MDKQTKEQKFVEKMGVYFETQKAPKMAGKIFGWLLICDPPYQSSEEIAQAVGGSKGSISTMTRYLFHFKLVERVGMPGQRKSYFRIPAMAWLEHLKMHLSDTEAIQNMTEDGLEILKGKPAKNRRRLEELKIIHEFLLEELPNLMLKLQRHLKIQMNKFDKANK